MTYTKPSATRRQIVGLLGNHSGQEPCDEIKDIT